MERKSEEEVAQRLYHLTQECKWEEVVEICKERPEICGRRITRSKDTALHLAVNDGQEDKVEELVGALMSEDEKKALEIKNERGDTPLHCAAARGSRKMCSSIAQLNSKLIEARNHKGETPLFLAALHGNTPAFLYLQKHINDKTIGPCRRRIDGDTILHCTIRRDHFELAYQIIHLYEGLVPSRDERGITPLHILANKPSAFESSSNFRWWNKSLYHCIIVEPLKKPKLQTNVDIPVKAPDEEEEQPMNNDRPSKSSVLNTIIRMGLRRKKGSKAADEENPHSDGHGHDPQNYSTFMSAFAYVVCLALEAFGLRDLVSKRQKHKWSMQILEALWKPSFEEDGIWGGSEPEGFLTREESLVEAGLEIFQKKAGAIDGKQSDGKDEKEKPLQQVATKNGVEMEEKPKAIQDWDEREKPLQLVATKNGVVMKILEEKPKAIEDWDEREMPLLVAAKNGVLEIVTKFLKEKPGAIHDTNSKHQNVLHVAVEYRQPHVFEFLRKESRLFENLVRSVDKDDNTLLHLGAKLSKYKPWHIPGAAMQMQWEIKWFLYIKELMGPYVLFQTNKQNKTPVEIFAEDHENLMKDGNEWLKSTSESCSVVAALIAGVAFATSSSIPGGTQEETGKPNLEEHPAFNAFALTSLLALCCSTTSLIMFLAILTSRQQPRDYRKDLPLKLLVGLSALFLSIAFILVSFCAAYFFVLKDKLKQVVFPLYIATCLPVTFYAIAQFPLYADLLRAIFLTTPQSSNRESEKLIL